MDPDGGFALGDIMGSIALDRMFWTAGGIIAGGIIGGATHGWDMNAVKNGALIGGGTALVATYLSQLPWDNIGNWLGSQFSSVSPYWILYNGLNVNVYKGKFGNASNLYMSLAGTSGYIYNQVAGLQENDFGPVPGGEYKINLSLSPRRFTQLAPNMATNEDLGVQRVINETGTRFNLLWGRWRARLEKIKLDIPTITRDNFYFHDSYKGYSHGCVETETALYYFLVSEHDAGSKQIKVRINYPKPLSSTNGGTGNLNVKVPANVKKYIPLQNLRNPDKDYPLIPIPKIPYIYDNRF